MAKFVLAGYETPKGINNAASVKTMQQKLGVTADGIWGPKTEAAYQKFLVQETANNFIGNFTNATPQEKYEAAAYKESWGVQNAHTTKGYSAPNGISNAAQVREAQKLLGVAADGIWGPNTQAAYEKSLKNRSTQEKGILGAFTATPSTQKSNALSMENELNRQQAQLLAASQERQWAQQRPALKDIQPVYKPSLPMLERKTMSNAVFSKEEEKQIQNALKTEAEIGSADFQQAYIEYMQKPLKERQEKAEYLRDTATANSKSGQTFVSPSEKDAPVLKASPWKRDKATNMPLIPVSDPTASVHSAIQPTVYNMDYKDWGDTLYFTPYYRSEEEKHKGHYVTKVFCKGHKPEELDLGTTLPKKLSLFVHKADDIDVARDNLRILLQMQFGTRSLSEAYLQHAFGDNLITEFPPIKDILDGIDPEASYHPVLKGSIVVKAVIERGDKGLFMPNQEQKVITFTPQTESASVTP